MDKICPLQGRTGTDLSDKRIERKICAETGKTDNARVPEYYFKPAMIPAKSEDVGKNQGKSDRGRKRFVSVLEDRTTEELIPLLYGKDFKRIISTLGAAGFECRDQQVKPAVLWKEYGIPLLLWRTVRQVSASDSGMR